MSAGVPHILPVYETSQASVPHIFSVYETFQAGFPHIFPVYETFEMITSSLAHTQQVNAQRRTFQQTCMLLYTRSLKPCNTPSSIHIHFPRVLCTHKVHFAEW